MSHVYRLHTGGAQTLDGWDNSKQYGPNEINNIVDPSGATANLPITSVPTPFAGLELARSAFEICGFVNKVGKNNLNGDSIYHKIVSFSLDTLEIFFNFKKFSSLFEIIPWNAQVEIANLLQSFDPAHQRLGQTLDLYINQDCQSFNFGPSTIFYLLNYKNGPAPLNIVGGTSPTTITVASTNDLSYTNVPLSGNHRAYDSDPMSFRSLIERDYEFIKYVWTLSLQYGFSNTYPEVYKYIYECFKTITDQKFKAELRNISASDIQYYEPIKVGAANITLPGGVVVGTYETPDPCRISDFTILSDYTTSKLPLVLPNESGYNEPNMRYVTGPWNPLNKAPFYDSRSMDKRTLPEDNTLYPYLTVDDIFQPYIIKTAFPIDDNAYFLGSYKSTNGYSFLLPLKKEIFKYLSLETICGTTRGVHAHNLFELRDIAGGGVEAIIQLPIQKGKYITMRRKYMKTDDEPKIAENRGVIVECTFDLYLYPSYHIVNNDVETPQRIYITDGDWRNLTKHFEYTIEAFKAQQDFGNNLITSVIQRADKHAGHPMTSKTFVANKEFDIIQVSNGFAEGMLIPKYAIVGNCSASYEFAIDFGTTNTHVEYRVNGGNIIKPLEMSVADSAILAMHPNNGAYEALFEDKQLEMFMDAPYQEFMPITFGANDITYFPLRTNICMSEANAAASNLKTKITLGDYSIGFHYERKTNFTHNKTITNLKWLGDGTQQYVSSFFEELLMIIRSKVLINGGSLKNTKITWFYPVSMEPFRLSQLKNEWESLCHNLINDHCDIQSVTESLAPFYYYKNSEGVSAAYRPVVLMDIGGGTTDFAVYKSNKAALISSVRFAGNSIYGDFPGFGLNMNGYFNKYEDAYSCKISETRIASLISAFNNVVSNGVSADFVSFLYSLEKNSELKKRNISISFSEDLKSDYSMKTTLLLFYVGEIYYLANVLKEKSIGTPAYLTISGTGSKVLDLIGGQTELQGLTKIIFNDIIGDDGKVELKQVKNPKEITCKGGLNMKPEDVIEDSDELRYCFAASKKIESFYGHARLKDIDSIAIDEIISFYNKFIEYFFELNSKYSFEKKFGINTQRNFDAYKEILLEHAQEDLAAVLDVRRSERNDPDAELEDSAFFFPLAGGLNRLAYYISKQ